MLLSASKASKLLGVSASTLRRWNRESKIQSSRLPSGHRVYNVESILRNHAITTTATTTTTSSLESQRESFVYARVSSSKQKEDLERQKQYLLSQFPNHCLISDIGSGINFKRSGLRSLLERSSRGLVKEVVVAHRDRLCRFAFNLLEFVFKLNDTKIVVLSEDNPTDEWELSQDILAINTVFICRLQGKRSAR